MRLEETQLHEIKFRKNAQPDLAGFVYPTGDSSCRPVFNGTPQSQARDRTISNWDRDDVSFGVLVIRKTNDRAYSERSAYNANTRCK